MKTLPERVRTKDAYFQCLVKVWVNSDDFDDIQVELSDNPAHDELLLKAWQEIERMKSEIQRKKLLRDA